MGNEAPRPSAISIAMAVCRCNTKHITQCSMPRGIWTPPLGDYLLHGAPAATRATANKTTMKKYTYFAGHSDGHGDAPVRYRAHRPMEKVQGFTGSHWTPPLGKYSLQ
jgi:hypothetical protein